MLCTDFDHIFEKREDIFQRSLQIKEIWYVVLFLTKNIPTQSLIDWLRPNWLKTYIWHMTYRKRYQSLSSQEKKTKIRKYPFLY